MLVSIFLLGPPEFTPSLDCMPFASFIRPVHSRGSCLGVGEGVVSFIDHCFADGVSHILNTYVLTTFYTVANPARGLLNREKRTNK